MKKFLLNNFVALLFIFGSTIFLRTDFSLLKIGTLSLFMSATDTAVYLLSKNVMKNKEKQKHSVGEYAQLLGSLTILWYLITFPFIHSVSLIFLSFLVYVSLSLFTVTMLQAGLETNKNSFIYMRNGQKFK